MLLLYHDVQLGSITLQDDELGASFFANVGVEEVRHWKKVELFIHEMLLWRRLVEICLSSHKHSTYIAHRRVVRSRHIIQFSVDYYNNILTTVRGCNQHCTYNT